MSFGSEQCWLPLINHFNKSSFRNKYINHLAFNSIMLQNIKTNVFPDAPVFKCQYKDRLSFPSLFMPAFKIHLQLIQLKHLLLEIIKLEFHCGGREGRLTGTNPDFPLRFVGELKVY